ncbi:dTDP-4-dehydrorhamnose 3,5-epimerase [Schinkia azotoformans]|uniref:dTDP-4-dehydrorhamnose 3,5-epimerase n=1 Tax=Schinkia azotoformans LMG 9581 TaxID=1131731 RepID=K6D3Z9_SCHAZ|nr:dTDP-4-dehydrorhamnose 3,5-epimerase [Schinkia azotoformans]EKN62788.1 dTDP-4-dehydrorhamnose 3,5-epimerase [Schinkia azotoformans LMG 9581]MEC1639163.1 dTDP-4-dehydrorhamnose 3,5-epimerase [Schinkia azotoformans]MEC1945751.1 dTDP-4-dehydrorhamnose 3,5-epimerase [Schinkia azotoformans]
MKVIKTKIPCVLIIEPTVFKDSRGFFMESYNLKEFNKLDINYNFIQDNHSLSVPAGTIRGLHYQLHPKAQTKLVRCVKGAIFDVVVDIRKGSGTFGKWVSVMLSEHNKRQLLVPTGFAHGFCTLVDNTEVTYKVDEYYSPENDRGILWNDSEIGIDWPVSDPILSDKDKIHPLLKEAEINFTI